MQQMVRASRVPTEVFKYIMYILFVGIVGMHVRVVYAIVIFLNCDIFDHYASEMSSYSFLLIGFSQQVFFPDRFFYILVFFPGG